MRQTTSSITVRTFAAARATLDSGGTLPVELVERWEAEQESWLLRLSDALDRGERELLEAYEAAYREAWCANTQLEAAPIAMPKAAPLAIAGPEAMAPDGLAPTAVSIDETAAISFASLGGAPLPFAGASAAPSPTAGAAAFEDNDQAGETSLGIPVVADDALPFGGKAAPWGTSIDETGMIDNALLEQALRSGSLPFDAALGVSSAPARAAAEEPHPDVGATGFMPALSFDDADLAPVEPAAPQSVAAAGIDHTAFMSAIVVDDDPLPFEAGEVGGAPAPVAAAMPLHAQVGGTKRVEISDAPVGSVMPFQPVTSMGTITIGHLTVQQVAALEVEIAHGLGRIHEILATFHLTRESYLALKEELERRSADPELKRFYEQERDAYLRWRNSSR